MLYSYTHMATVGVKGSTTSVPVVTYNALLLLLAAGILCSQQGVDKADHV